MHVCIGKGCQFPQQHAPLSKQVWKRAIGYLVRVKYQGEKGGVSRLGFMGVRFSTGYEINCIQAAASRSARSWI